jgi:hypothetical protein
MRLSSETHFQYADAAPAVHVALLGDGRMPSPMPVIAPTGGTRHPHALARRPMR